jgi:hypothetical protein
MHTGEVAAKRWSLQCQILSLVLSDVAVHALYDIGAFNNLWVSCWGYLGFYTSLGDMEVWL